MALPWLIGAAAVATVGYLISDDKGSSNNSNDDYYERKKDAERRERKRKEKEIKEEEKQFCKKWGVDNLDSDFDDSTKIKKLTQKEQALEKKIEKLETLAKEINLLYTVSIWQDYLTQHS